MMTYNLLTDYNGKKKMTHYFYIFPQFLREHPGT